MTKFCRKCGSETGRFPSGGCKPCGRAASLRWAKANPAKVKTATAKWYATHDGAAKSRERYAANPEKAKAIAAKFRAKHPEILRERYKRWYDAHPGYYTERYRKNPEPRRAEARAQRAKDPEKYREAYRAWRKDNPEKARAATAAWIKANPDRVKEHARLRTWRANGWTKELYEAAWVAQNGKCAICPRRLSRAWRHIDSAFADHDHETGKPRGILCRNCNTALGLVKDSIQWMDDAKAYLEKYRGE
jgi:Recombination endonuclease VII